MAGNILSSVEEKVQEYLLNDFRNEIYRSFVLLSLLRISYRQLTERKT